VLAAAAASSRLDVIRTPGHDVTEDVSEDTLQVSGDGDNMLSKGKAKARGGFHAGCQPSCKEPTELTTVTKFRCQTLPRACADDHVPLVSPFPLVCASIPLLSISQSCLIFARRNAAYLQLTRIAYMILSAVRLCPLNHGPAFFVYFS
jgi:hypothetical protein